MLDLKVLHQNLMNLVLPDEIKKLLNNAFQRYFMLNDDRENFDYNDYTGYINYLADNILPLIKLDDLKNNDFFSLLLDILDVEKIDMEVEGEGIKDNDNNQGCQKIARPRVGSRFD
jgi:hypothetical protein